MSHAEARMEAGSVAAETEESGRGDLVTGEGKAKIKGNKYIELYVVYWNSYPVFNDYRQLRIPLPLTHRRRMLA